MDDSCAVCADSLEWVGYGACGHKDVCSTCVARLRFICDDRRCCICKTDSNFVFITKALGDYTRNINDFSVFSTEAKEGRVGSYWYHEDTQAFFDDLDQYNMVKAMCRLSCSVCDKDESSNDGSRRRIRFRNVEQLKGHLFHNHRLIMCSLCLEGRKVFICEQKLYTRAQLNQHIHSGDSEVDGSESDRGGFMGHPLCEFCQTPFYGDNELYTHMSTEHYTCHICQRQHPGQYEYYKNYDDLEKHFRGNHFLCEDESCLAKKFIVFPSESELKRHNTVEHGGHMSRSQRNAALQIPTSFRYRRYNEEENRRGRARAFRRDNTNDTELSMAIEASLEISNPPPDVASDGRETSDIDPSGGTDSVRYLQAVSRNARIEESSFPPLPTPSGSSNSQQKSQSDASVRNNSMAARIRHQNNRASKNTPVANTGWPAVPAGSSSSSNQRAWPALGNATSSPVVIDNSRNWVGGNNTRSISHSVSAPSLVHTGGGGGGGGRGGGGGGGASTSDFTRKQKQPFDSSTSDFPPVSVLQVKKQPTIENVHNANKSLVERIRAALNDDEEKYTEFKNMSGEYRQGTMDAETYLVYVEQFGLSHVVLELARLCPDPQKQKELIDIYNANKLPQENGMKKGKGKGKGKGGGSNNTLADNFVDSVRKLQSGGGGYNVEDDVEVLSKDGYRGKSKLPNESSSSSVNNGDEKSKQQRKKTSKFHRLRLGNDSAEATLGGVPSSNSEAHTDINETDTNEGLPVRGVWRNKGGQKLVSMTSRASKN